MTQYMIDICWNATEKINYLQWSQNISHNQNDKFVQPLQHTWPWKWHETSSLAKFKNQHVSHTNVWKKTCCRMKQIRIENHKTRSKQKTFASVLGGGTEATNAARFCNWIILVWIISSVRCQHVATKGSMIYKQKKILQFEVTKNLVETNLRIPNYDRRQKTHGTRPQQKRNRRHIKFWSMQCKTSAWKHGWTKQCHTGTQPPDMADRGKCSARWLYRRSTEESTRSLLFIAVFAKFFVAPATNMPYYVHTHEFCMVTRRKTWSTTLDIDCDIQSCLEPKQTFYGLNKKTRDIPVYSEMKRFQRRNLTPWQWEVS